MRIIYKIITVSIFLASITSACTTSPAAKLAGTKWNLILLEVNGESFDLSQANQITLKIADKGAVSGSAGCNSYFGTIKFKSNGNVIVNTLGNTEMACMKGMQIESAYLDALRLGGNWSREGTADTLTITSKNGASVIAFVKVDS